MGNLGFPILQFIMPKGFRHKALEMLCTEKRLGKLDFQTRSSVWNGTRLGCSRISA